MSSFSIRAARDADAPAIVSLLAELAAYEKLQDSFCLTEETVRRDMLGTVCQCELAFADDVVCGVASWFWTYKSFRARCGLFVEDLYVRPEFRGRGLGKLLLIHLAAKARDAGGFLEWQVLDWNRPAVAFYQSLGAAPVADWLTYRLEGEKLERFAS